MLGKTPRFRGIERGGSLAESTDEVLGSLCGALRVFSVIGTNHCKHLKGYTLLLCPICRCVRVFSVFALERYTSIYHVPVSPATPTGTLLSCHDCDIRLAVKSSYHLSVHHCPLPETLWELLAPSVRERLLQEAQAELELLRDPASAAPEKRLEALARPFVACEAELESQLEGGQIHRSTFLPQFGSGMLGAGGAGLMIAALLQPANSAWFVVPAIFGTSLLLSAAILWHKASSRYLFTNSLKPKLVRSLTPLAPCPEELTRLVSGLSRDGLYIASFVAAEELCQSIAERDRQERW